MNLQNIFLFWVKYKKDKLDKWTNVCEVASLDTIGYSLKRNVLIFSSLKPPKDKDLLGNIQRFLSEMTYSLNEAF